MFKGMFFGMYVGVTLAGAILIDNDGDNPWSAAWFILLSGLVLM